MGISSGMASRRGNLLGSAFLQKGPWLKKEFQTERKTFLFVRVIDLTSEHQIHIQMLHVISQAVGKIQGK